jgi:hypothetical protein
MDNEAISIAKDWRYHSGSGPDLPFDEALSALEPLSESGDEKWT